jgi:hypothetical protein
MRLPELDDEPISLTALCLRSAMQDLFEAGEVMIEGRRMQRLEASYVKGEIQAQDIEFGYDIAPTGLTETFGAWCQSPAWLSIHKVGPALLFRRNDELDDDIGKWLEHWASTLDVRKPWPVQQEHTDLIVPCSMQDMMRKAKRTARFKGRDVRRFLGLGH